MSHEGKFTIVTQIRLHTEVAELSHEGEFTLVTQIRLHAEAGEATKN